MSAPAQMAIGVTEAAVLAALEAVKDGATVTADHQEAISIGLVRAAARWWAMTTPDFSPADQSFLRGVSLALQQERAVQNGPRVAGNA